jgi:molybdopterin-synthase adenylyltransferase
MNDQQLQRYARHVLLDGIGIDGQRKLLAAHALLIGAGGLGSPVALYLGSAGVGRITVVDHDHVDLTNLQRQIAHNQSRVGLPKAESAQASVAAINPDVQLRALVRRADAALLDDWVPQADVVIDCTDNFRTRHAVNAACVKHARPLVWGAAIGWDAQMSVYDPRPELSSDPSGDQFNKQSPCYACLFAPDAGHEDVACATMGVLAPLVGIVGSLQAAEAIKLLVGGHESLSGRLLMLDGRSMRWDEMKTQRQAHCAVCSTPH